MAKEAIERVKLAEEKAAQILETAEREAADMVAAVGKEAQSSLEQARVAASVRIENARTEAKKRESEMLSAAETDIELKCAERRAAILKNKETIIGRITEAVKN